MLFGCDNDPEPSKTIDLEQFTIQVTGTWVNIPKKGYDSKVGVLSNGRDELAFDYGWYSYDFARETSDTHTRTNTIIDGKDALIVQPKKRGEGIIGVYIEVDDVTKLNIYGEDIRDEKTVLEIFNSIKFKN